MIVLTHLLVQQIDQLARYVYEHSSIRSSLALPVRSAMVEPRVSLSQTQCQ